MSPSTNVNQLSAITSPAPRPDTLTGAVLISLSRPLGNIFSWGLLKTFILGAITFGIVPLFALSKRLRHSTGLERAQLWHLAEWMRTNCGEECAPLVKSAEQIRTPFFLVLAPLCGFAGLIWLVHTAIHFHASFGQLLDATYRYFPAQARDRAPHWAHEVFIVWTGLLGVGYIALWLAMQMQQNTVRKYLRIFDTLATRQGAAPMPSPQIALGLRPLWVFAGFVLSIGGAVWAIPMMLAGAAQRRYTKRIGARVRVDLAERVRQIMQMRAPAMPVPMPVAMLRTCGAQRCAAKLPPGARFCPRCGTKAEEIALVA